MEQGKVGGHMFAFQYKRNNFLHGDNNVWIFWDEMYQLLQADALEAQLICFCHYKSYVYMVHNISY
jgi:hypothetical protein